MFSSLISDTHRFLTKVYAYMGLSLLISFFSAYYFAQSGLYMELTYNLGPHLLLYGIVVFAIEMAVVFGICKVASGSPGIALALLLVFSAFDGCTMASIFAVFQPAIIMQAFLISAVTFGSMSFVGVVTKKDLSGWSRQLFGALIAFIVISFIDLFFRAPMVTLFVSLVGVVIFALFITFDTNRIVKGDLGNSNGSAVVGALDLYLDFINLFMNILQILGMFDRN